jgi:hypothetical protein
MGGCGWPAETTQAAVSELLETRDALAESRHEAHTLAKDVAWLAAQSAEDQALRRAARQQLQVCWRGMAGGG